MGNHLSGNGNYLHSRGNLFPHSFLLRLTSVIGIVTCQMPMCLNLGYEAEPDGERFTRDSRNCYSAS